MVTVTPFMGKLKVHIRQFYVNEKGEKKPGKNSITLQLEKFDKLVKLIPQVKTSPERYELRDTGIPSCPSELDLPILHLDTVFLPCPPLQEPVPIIGDEELLDGQPKFPSPPSTLPDVPPPLIDPSLENDLDDLDFYVYVPGKKRKRSNERSKKNKKKPKTENKRTSGVFVGYCEELPEMKVTEKNGRKSSVKRETIDEVASVESMKEVERKLWLTHYDMLCKKLLEVIREK